MKEGTIGHVSADKTSLTATVQKVLNDTTWDRKGQIALKATTARDARRECLEFAPCSLYGYDKNDECVLITTVYPKGHPAYVATARRNRSFPAMSFTRGPYVK